MSSQQTLQRALQDAQSGRLDAAIAAVRTVVRVQPRNADALQMLGLLLAQSGQHGQAVVQLERAVSIAPQVAGYRNNLGNALMGAGRARDAAAQFRAAVEVDPSYARAFLGLGLALAEVHDSDGAVEACRRGLALRPTWPELALCAASALEAADRLPEAIDWLRSAVASSPAHEQLRGRLAFALNYAALPAVELAAEHRAYRDRISRAQMQPPDRPRDPARPIRIGVLSGDLRTHSVGFFAEPIYRTKLPGDALVSFSSSAPAPHDAVQARFREMSDAWVEAAMLSDDALDRAVREQGIDVLVELSGHTRGGRLAALDRKPAPVIVTAIGYPNTTGHPAVDWRIVDTVTDPAGAEDLCTERLLRIDPCFLCYVPSADAGQPSMPPADGPVTFGSFNLTSKVTDATIALWAAALDAVPGSRLLVKSKSIADPSTRERVQRRLASGGIAPERLETVAYTAGAAEHFALYGRVHVALDTTPYNGTTTTCEALWMGVPVVTLEGDRHAARVGASLLRAAGKPGWIARTPAEFASIAAGLARDREGLVAWRAGARGALRASSLLDVDAYGARFHGALRDAWAAWCGGAPQR
ncbi:MAG: tetratricopeptide repeat protein [Planctomycetes bacterium]|nr:tetratricopeptide repeat protein [Planctomycetota bacterium]